jgi:LPS export ABC transporter protein LptC
MFRFSFVLITILFSLSNCIAANTFAQIKNPQEPVQQMGNFSLTGITEKGRKNWDITGKSADIGSEVIKLNDIEGNLYGETEDVKLTAAKGDFNRQQGSLHLEKNVVVTTSSGAKMTTDSLVWDRKEQLVSTRDPVNIERQDVIITAQGAKGYPDLNKVALEKDVQMQISSKETDPQGQAGGNAIVINCDGPLQIDYQKNIATFNNNVKVLSPDGVIQSDILEVYFLSKDKEKTGKTVDSSSFGRARIEKIIARGNVKITRDENVSYSEEAVYSASDRKITLSGKPKLVIYQAEALNASSFGN